MISFVFCTSTSVDVLVLYETDGGFIFISTWLRRARGTFCYRVLSYIILL